VVTVDDEPVAVAELTTEAQVAAILHPLRRRVLAALTEPGSPAEVARHLGIAPQVANYHVRALEAAGLARQVETRQKRNLLEHRFRAIARSFTLSTTLPLTEQQRKRLQGDIALQQLVRAGDTIREDALRLLESPPSPTTAAPDAPPSAAPPTAPPAATPADGGHPAAPASGHAAAAVEIEIDLPGDADRTAFVRAVMDAVEAATAPYRVRHAPAGGARPRQRHAAGAHHHPYRMHLAIYPVPAPATAPERPRPSERPPSPGRSRRSDRPRSPAPRRPSEPTDDS
jgi:DNA-binding transcriptional ArsR family regulator